MADESGCTIGIDVGGTSIKAGVMSLDGDILKTVEIPTGEIVTQDAYQRIVSGLRGLVAEAGRTDGDVRAMGLDVPGPVDDEGHVGFFPNIQLDPEGLSAALGEAFPNVQLAFVNDANAAALGELWKGSAAGIGSFVMVTLGTGVGGGVVIGGRLVPGAFGAAGEIGHITVVPEGEERVCGCGRHGCLEQYASAKGIVWLYRRECERRGVAGVTVAHDTDTLSVFRALSDGDECARVAVDAMCEYLGRALAQISTIIDPAVYLIGGGVAGGFDLFSAQLSACFRAHCLSTSSSARILPCSLGNAAGMYGAAFAALRAAGLV
ncbi:ROK family protein [Olsenella sp. HMSC062G07]|uniref:ROK family protein n=1 Tax=Olsenella sp. HMSC062G07 TaxID=1739330 RepID=UPI0008A5BC6D|nr:ROK family protein [Olsenella sp. HMSC062G07]OFK23402.1 sugar kinase [Olsenella sp. HMSC062G07]